MIRELAEIDVKPGSEAEFERAVAEAVPSFQQAKGCRSFKLERSIEKPNRYYLVVAWDEVDDHMVHFRASDGFQTWRALVGPYFESPPRVQHIATALKGF